MSSLSFSSSIFVNSEPIEQNLNSIFANKYGKIQCWLRNYEKLQEITNSSISDFTLSQIFVYIQKYSVYTYSDLISYKAHIQKYWS